MINEEIISYIKNAKEHGITLDAIRIWTEPTIIKPKEILTVIFNIKLNATQS